MSDDRTAAERAQEIRVLERELVEARSARVAMQRKAAEGPLLAISAERVERDRSALSTPKIEDLRALVQERFDDLHEMWATVQNIRDLQRRLRRTYPGNYSALDAALSADDDCRRQAEESAAEAGVALSDHGSRFSGGS